MNYGMFYDPLNEDVMTVAEAVAADAAAAVRLGAHVR